MPSRDRGIRGVHTYTISAQSEPHAATRRAASSRRDSESSPSGSAATEYAGAGSAELDRGPRTANTTVRAATTTNPGTDTQSHWSLDLVGTIENASPARDTEQPVLGDVTHGPHRYAGGRRPFNQA